MKDDPRTLGQIQRWMQAVVTHPDGVARGIDSDGARAEVDVTGEQVGRVVNPSTRRTSLERLEIYANAYYARLLECLRDEFPALVHAVGAEAFGGLAFGYLQSCPPASYTLAELGRRFPDYLDETRPAEQDGQAGPGWPDFIVDLARLERTYGEVFDGVGMEGRPLLTPAQIEAIPAARRAEARLRPVPCLRLLSLRFPAHEYATAVRTNPSAAFPDSSPTWLAISRIDYVVRRWRLAAAQFALLEGLLAGDSLQAAIQRAAAAAPGAGVGEFAADLRAWFHEWAAAGFFQAIET